MNTQKCTYREPDLIAATALSTAKACPSADNHPKSGTAINMSDPRCVAEKISLIIVIAQQAVNWVLSPTLSLTENK